MISLYGVEEGKEICNKIFEHLDLDGSGEISYDEFLSAMIDTKKLSQRTNWKERLRYLIKMGMED